MNMYVNRGKMMRREQGRTFQTQYILYPEEGSGGRFAPTLACANQDTWKNRWAEIVIIWHVKNHFSRPKQIVFGQAINIWSYRVF